MPLIEFDPPWPPRWAKLVVIFVWLCGWGVFEVMLVAGLFGLPLDWKGPPYITWSYLLILAFWTLAGPTAFWFFLKTIRRRG